MNANLRNLSASLTLALACAFLIAACAKQGGDGENAASAASSNWPDFDDTPNAAVARQPLPRACSLVTAEEAQTVLGQTVGQMSDEPENCIWASSEHPGRITMLMVQLMREETPESADTVFDALTGAPGQLNAMVNQQMGAKTNKSGQEIEGLGDVAWRSASNADLIGTEQLIVRKGLLILVLNVTGMPQGGDASALGPRLETAGRAALTRIGAGT